MNLPRSVFRRCVVASLCVPVWLFAIALFASPAAAQSEHLTAKGQVRSVAAKEPDIPALFISDIHFDPFHDPGKVKELAAAPVARWKGILSAVPSPDQPQAFEALQSRCHARGVDTPFALLQSSLLAMKSRQPNARFIVVSGDLIAHAFTCRYNAEFPDATPGGYEAFVEKTLAYVMEELRAAFPGVPVYTALGNNDSACGDYQLDSGNNFLAKTGPIIAEGLPAQERQRVATEFAAGGYYSVPMAAPMKRTRMIVVNDLFLSPKYRTCSGKADSTGATEEMSWFERQLKQARQAGEKVWVVGHIPPGIDPYSTLTKFRNVCAGQDPVAFLASDRMADLIVEYADTVRLGVFAHTHMDEVRLLTPNRMDAQASSKNTVAVKMIPSISPVDGNNPSFTIARINPDAARIDDYKVIAASNQTGIDTQWSEEYDYAKTYRETQFAAADVAKLIDGFRADAGANTAASQAYLSNYFVGNLGRALTPFWPQYVCALNHYTVKGYAACVCSGGQR